MKKGRLYDHENGTWLNEEDEPDIKANAMIVSHRTWELLYEDGFEFIELGTDEILRQEGAEMLPGFETLKVVDSE